MAYHLVADILGAIILAATFLLCLRSFRREDQRHAQSSGDVGVARSSHGAGVSKQTLAELLNLMDAGDDRTVGVGHSPVMGGNMAGATRTSGVEDCQGAGVFTRQSSGSPLNVMDEIEVTVRVNTQRTSAAARPVGSQEIVNAEWEQVYPEITGARRLASSRAVQC